MCRGTQWAAMCVFAGSVLLGVGLGSRAYAAKPCDANGVLDKGETCDPQAQLFKGNTTCETLGYSGGALACTDTCQVDESGCTLAPEVVFPGDGYPNTPEEQALGINHGPALSYTDNGDGTFTDNNTQLMWEMKDDLGGVHDKDNTYTWTGDGFGGTAANGTLFTDFLVALNTEPCFAGHCDWRIPNIRELRSIVDYSKQTPSTSFPGLTALTTYWSSTTNATSEERVWVINFDGGNGGNNFKDEVGNHARAVRGGQ